jgi:hypothetical protein
MTGQFTVEEINLMCIYDTSNRLALIDALVDAMTDYEDDELFELAVRVAERISSLL